ncbi:rod-binding protein [Shewanella sp. GXUN23E]|uniref:rod-binding protein n=1 Tax=Shewanella sp. GXUN23E TaxID=3422498 RepID=UPI003D7E19FA
MKLTNNQGVLGKLDAGDLIKSNGEYGALKQVSQQFEAQFLQTVLKQMRTASDVLADEDSVFSSQNDGMYRDWYDSELAGHLSQVQSTGLAEVMTAQLAAGLQSGDGAVALNQHRGQAQQQPVTHAMQPALILPWVSKEPK